MAEDVTVVVPTTLRDRGRLVRAIASAAARTVAPTEIVVVVDRPEPGRLPNLEAQIPVRVTRNGQKPGPSGARSTGIAAARSHLVALLDDDYWQAEKLEHQLALRAALPPDARQSGLIARVARRSPRPVEVDEVLSLFAVGLLSLGETREAYVPDMLAHIRRHRLQRRAIVRRLDIGWTSVHRWRWGVHMRAKESA